MHHCITIVGHIKRGKLRSRRLSLCSQVPKCTKAMPYPIVYIVSNLPKMCNLTSSDKVFAQLNKYPFAMYIYVLYYYSAHEYYLLIMCSNLNSFGNSPIFSQSTVPSKNQKDFKAIPIYFLHYLPKTLCRIIPQLQICLVNFNFYSLMHILC